MNKSTYIKAVIIVFGLLIISRVPNFLKNELSPLIIVSTIVELSFIIWGLRVLRINTEQK